MSPESPHRERLHQRVAELIPWYVNGSLEPGERELAARHLAECAACRAEVEREQRLAAACREVEPPAPALHGAQVERLLARLPPSRWADLPRWARRLLAAQAAALVLLVAGAAALWRQRAEPVFRTLSAPVAAQPAAAGAARLRVVFAETATEAEIRRLLGGVRGELVGGPSPLGVYTVALPSDGEPIAVVLAHLRAQPQVRFAEPVTGSGD
jgi:anti-sigma factor RsiW